MPQAVVIGAGFAGLSAASSLAQAGWQVTLLEKNNGPGGRARVFEAEGFTFDMGPSWYWMPDVFEQYFQKFGKRVADYYWCALTRRTRLFLGRTKPWVFQLAWPSCASCSKA
jgi:phytoene dehydrogenase-like protein